MTHGPEHHIEHAEHAAHATHDDFNKRVTMSIAIVAAVLACVTMLGHRAHNETLLVQGEVLHLQGDAMRIQGEALRTQSEALQLQTMASIESTNAANKWSYYQTKNLFHLESKIMTDLLKVVAIDGASQAELKKVRGVYQGNVDKYDVKLPEIQKEAETLVKKSDDFMHQAQGRIREAQDKLTEYQKKMAESEKKKELGHEIHAKADRFDYGELGLQFGVVLCSLAILMRSRAFWVCGLISALIGALIALTGVLGLFIAHH